MSDPSLTSIKNQQVRLGSNLQQERMIADKKRSLKRALQYSYQGADVRKITPENESDAVRALINSNKLKQDYDDKIISIFYDYNYEPGTIFEWLGTNTYWLIYLQELTELAYFRGDIRKCSHEITWEDEDGQHSTFAAIRGPVETQIDYIQKHGISVDNPNLSLNILMPLNEFTLKYFQRYQKFYLKNDVKKVCWRVTAIDWLSMPGILEVNAVEYYANETEDDIENGIIGGLIVEPANPNNKFIDEVIKGESFIKPKLKYQYTYKGNLEGSWSVDKDIPVLLEQDGKTVTITWLKTFSGQFDLYYANAYKKTIVVESLF